MDASDLGMLRRKYVELLRLRELHDRAKADPSFSEPNPRPAMARLADAFPGALRELDSLPLDVIATRIRALSHAEKNPRKVALWMRAQALFHRLARGALSAKRWLGRRRKITSAVETAFRHAHATDGLAHPRDAHLWSAELVRVAMPPRGRLMDAVYARVAAELEISAEEVRELVFSSRSHSSSPTHR